MPSNSDMISYHARLLEAILFIAERPVSVAEIKQKLLIDDDEVAQLLSLLEQNLKTRNSFIELVKSEQGQAIEMRINEGIKKELDLFRTKKSLSKDLMKTLAYIALEQPLKYGDLKKVRGQKTREHVEALEKEGYIKQEPSGRTFILMTTLYFASVFNLDPDHIKETFKEQLAKRMEQLTKKAEGVQQPASEVKDVQQPASEVKDVQQLVSEAEDMQQPASEIKDVQQLVSEAEDMQQPASEVEDMQQPADEIESVKPPVDEPEGVQRPTDEKENAEPTDKKETVQQQTDRKESDSPNERSS